MKNLIMLFAICLVLAGVASAQTTAADKSGIRIFAINLSPVTVDIQLGDDPIIFQASGLAPNTAAKMSRSQIAGGYQAHFRKTGDKMLATSRNQEGQPFLYTLAAGKIYLIRILNETTADIYEISEPDKPSINAPDKQAAKIMFVNNTADNVPLIQIASAFNQNVLVSMKDLPAKEHCNFGTVNFPADYGCFWTTATMPSGTTNYTIADTGGKSILNKYNENTYWILVLWNDTGHNNVPTGTLTNITP